MKFEDYFETDDDFDEEEHLKFLEEQEEALIKYIETFSKRLQELSLAKDIIFNATALSIMMSMTRPKIYSKYWCAVRNLIYNFMTYKNTGTIDDNITEERKEADQLLNGKLMLTKRYPGYNASINMIGEFNMCSTSIDICLTLVEAKNNEEIIKLIESLKLNDVLDIYYSAKIEELAKECLEIASNTILIDSRKN